ncbi:MAG: hypothetical protein AB7V55_04355 [Oscillospiraceae bacterium]
MRKKIIPLLLCAAALLAFSACGFLAEKTDEIREQLDGMQAQYDELQQLYGDMKDMLLGNPDAEKPETQGALMGIESQLMTYENVLTDEPEAYYDLEGLQDIEREMQATKEQMETAIENENLQNIIESGEIPGFDPNVAGEYDTDNLAGQKTMRILELMTEIQGAMKPGNESWDAAFRELGLRYQAFSMDMTMNNPDAYEDGAPGNAELLEQLDGFIAEYEEMLAGIS